MRVVGGAPGVAEEHAEIARALPAGCRVFVFETEHHASLLPWQEAHVTYLDAPRTPRQAVETLERALAGRDPHGPALVCVTGASNVTGELWPVRLTFLALLAAGVAAQWAKKYQAYTGSVAPQPDWYVPWSSSGGSGAGGADFAESPAGWSPHPTAASNPAATTPSGTVQDTARLIALSSGNG